MESFAAVVRTLLTRIRAIQASHSSGQWPPSASAVATTGAVYRVRPTTWGVEEAGGSAHASDSEPSDRSVRDASASTYAGARRRLRLTVYGLPEPRGLLST